MEKRTYEEQVAEFNRIKVERGYVPYHLHRAIFAEPMSMKAELIYYSIMLFLPLLTMFLCSIFGPCP